MKYSIPLYLQLYNSLLEKIESGYYIPGQMLDSERAMASEYSVNRETVKKALTLLEKDGHIERIQGRGTFVSKRNTESISFDNQFINKLANSGITAKLKNTGYKSSSKIITKGVTSDLKLVSKKLRIHLHDYIFVLHRIRYADDMPLSVEYVYSPMSIMDDDIFTTDFENVSFYDYLNKLNHLPVHFSRIFKAVKCSEKEAQYLQIKPLTPVYLCEDIARDQEGRVIEYVRTYIRTDMMRISFNSYTKDY